MFWFIKSSLFLVDDLIASVANVFCVYSANSEATATLSGTEREVPFI